MTKRMIGFFVLLATFLSTVSQANTALDPYRNTYPMGPFFCSHVAPNPKDDFGRYVNLIGPKQVDVSKAPYACVTDAEGITCWRSHTSYCHLEESWTSKNGFEIANIHLDWQHKLKNVVTVATGERHYCALTKTAVHCWGDNRKGQLDVPSLKNPRALVVHEDTSCVLDDDGINCWGDTYWDWFAEGRKRRPDLYPRFEKKTRSLNDVPAELGQPLEIFLDKTHLCARDSKKILCWGLDRQGDKGLESAVISDLQSPELEKNTAIEKIISAGTIICVIYQDGSKNNCVSTSFHHGFAKAITTKLKTEKGAKSEKRVIALAQKYYRPGYILAIATKNQIASHRFKIQYQSEADTEGWPTFYSEKWPISDDVVQMSIQSFYMEDFLYINNKGVLKSVTKKYLGRRLPRQIFPEEPK